eukprot:TRINITY_DN60036_c0_g1_i2.p1 TRINITY_DN60036_c0_g1~~TRINITY_DN60036_c0_g1_i2.p1  ORF type:complete len:375 (-),score=56.36 TRINITY_DN60036_c0_g1_i2:232-1356(-)
MMNNLYLFICFVRCWFFSFVFFFFKQKTAYEMLRSLVGSEMCIRDRMMAEVAAHFSHQEGQHFASVEAFNEPISTWWRSTGTQEGCHFEVGTQKSVLLALRGALDAAGLKETMIASSDENTYTEAISTWAGLGDSARGVVDQVNVHGYEYGGGRRDELYAAVSKAGKRLWNSEYGEGDATGLQMATNLNLDLQWLHPTAWVYWQVLDGGGWGLMAVDEPNKKIENVNLKYYVLAQYSRHIRPGFEIVSSGEDRNTVAAISSDGVLVMVTTNYGDAQWVTYDLSGFVYGGGGVDRWRTETGGGTSTSTTVMGLCGERGTRRLSPISSRTQCRRLRYGGFYRGSEDGLGDRTHAYEVWIVRCDPECHLSRLQETSD